jgi:hypothetical protein
MTVRVMSKCKLAPVTGLHNWYTVGHSRDWMLQRVYCSRCKAEAVATSAQLEQYAAVRDANDIGTRHQIRGEG